MSNPKQTAGRGRAPGARALILGASLSTIAAVGMTTAPRAQSAAEEACAGVLHLRSPFTVERVLRTFSDDPCIPIMLASLSPDLLSRINPDLVTALPREQLRNVPRSVLEILGIDPRLGSTRAIQNPYGY